MKKTALFFALALLLALLCGCAGRQPAAPAPSPTPAPPPLEDVAQEGEGCLVCSFDGVKHRVLLELPEPHEGAPLVLMLHGYGNNAESFRLQTAFEEAALPRGYAVAYVTGAPDPSVPTSATGWNSEAKSEGNRDTEFLCALAHYLQESYSLDSARTYAAGFSNGGFMAHRLAMDAADTFAACVSVGGLMPESVWNARREENAVGFFQITGEKDDVVPKNSDGSARYSRAPAIEDAIEYWAASDGLELKETVPVGNESSLTRYAREGKPQQVWHLVVTDGRHSWPDEGLYGIDTNALILDFLDTQTDQNKGE